MERKRKMNEGMIERILLPRNNDLLNDGKNSDLTGRIDQYLFAFRKGSILNFRDIYFEDSDGATQHRVNKVSDLPSAQAFSCLVLVHQTGTNTLSSLIAQDYYISKDSVQYSRIKKHIFALLLVLRKFSQFQKYIHGKLSSDNVFFDKKGNAFIGVGALIFGDGTKCVGVSAPENLLEMDSECEAIFSDMWSVGCLFSEMMMNYPPFKGFDESDCLLRIFAILGFPKRKDIPYVGPDLYSLLLDNVASNNHSSKLGDYFPDYSYPESHELASASLEALNFAHSLLKYSPRCRVSPEIALKSRLFADINAFVSSEQRKRRKLANNNSKSKMSIVSKSKSKSSHTHSHLNVGKSHVKGILKNKLSNNKLPDVPIVHNSSNNNKSDNIKSDNNMNSDDSIHEIFDEESEKMILFLNNSETTREISHIFGQSKIIPASNFPSVSLSPKSKRTQILERLEKEFGDNKVRKSKKALNSFSREINKDNMSSGFEEFVLSMFNNLFVYYYFYCYYYYYYFYFNDSFSIGYYGDDGSTSSSDDDDGGDDDGGCGVCDDDDNTHVDEKIKTKSNNSVNDSLFENKNKTKDNSYFIGKGKDKNVENYSNFSLIQSAGEENESKFNLKFDEMKNFLSQNS